MLQERLTLPVGALVQDGFRGQYRVERLLGKGGFSAVYLVRDQRDRSRVFALKEVIDPNKQERKQLFFEYKVLKELHHQALPQVYHIFEQERPRRVYLLMEYIRGKNLEVLHK